MNWISMETSFFTTVSDPSTPPTRESVHGPVIVVSVERGRGAPFWACLAMPLFRFANAESMLKNCWFVMAWALVAAERSLNKDRNPLIQWTWRTTGPLAVG